MRVWLHIAILSLVFLAPSSLYAQTVGEVVVTGTPLMGDAIDQLQSVAEISRDEIISSGGFGLGDSLRNVAGITSSGFSPGAARPIIRGFDASRVRVTENGIGSHDVSDISADHGVPIDPLSAVEVEVLRGPGTLRYGSQAIGGVVNAINNRIPFDISDGQAGEIFVGGARNALERMAGGTFDHREGGFALHADAFLRGADSYDTPNGKQENSFAFGRGFALGGAYVEEAGAIGASYNNYYSHYGIPTEPGGETAHIDLNQSNYSGALRLNDPIPGIKSINGRIGFSDYMHKEIVDGAGVLSTFNNDEWEGRLEVLHSGIGAITTGALGLQWGDRDFAAIGEGADYLSPSNTKMLGGYAFERLALGDSLNFEVAFRLESVQVRGATTILGGATRDFTPISIALGANFRPSETMSLSVNLSQTERAPNVVELFAQGPHEASATFEFGDSNIGKEQARSIEAGLHYDGTDGAHGTFNIFATDFDGFVAGVLTGDSYDEDGNFISGGSGEFAELIYLQRNASFFGFEAQAHIPLVEIAGGRAGIDLQADYVRAKFDAGGNVPRIPPLRYGGGVFLEADEFGFNLRALRSDAQSDIAVQESATAGFTMIEAVANYRLYEGDAGAMNLVFSASNILDQTARNHVSFTKGHVLLPGRSFRLVLDFIY
jgi:iron complex outermembrane receptor protein